MDKLPRLGKRELICLLLFTCNYVVSLWRGFLFRCVLGMGYVILLWHSLSLPLIISNKNLKANKKGEDHGCIAYIPILDIVETRDIILSNNICDGQRHWYAG